MLFKKEYLQELACGSFDNFVSISEDIVNTSRWTVEYKQIFKFTDEQGVARFYKTYYSRGATEQQDERPYEFKNDLIECTEVVPVKKQVTVYVDKKESKVE
jgi:hypothetical protein